MYHYNATSQIIELSSMTLKLINCRFIQYFIFFSSYSLAMVLKIGKFISC